MTGQDPNEADEQAAPEAEQLPIPGSSAETYLDRLKRYLSLSLSLPERSARALSSLVGGSTLLLTRTLVPSAIKSSTSYRFTVGMFQAFLIRNVAGMDQVPQDVELKDRFVHRKLLGTSLEAAGLLTMHLSPVWVFAIASDAARGGQVFLQRLVGHLKDNEIIDKDSDPQSLEQILLSIQDMGRQGATAIDTPPMSVDEIKALADELRQSTAMLAANSSSLLPRFEAIWNQIGLVARKENLSIEQILGMLSVSAASVAETGIGTASAVGKTGYTLLDEVVLNDYKQTLTEISEEGYLRYLSDHMRPFLQNAQSHFDFQRETATQRWFKNAIGRFMARLRSGK